MMITKTQERHFLIKQYTRQYMTEGCMCFRIDSYKVAIILPKHYSSHQFSNVFLLHAIAVVWANFQKKYAYSQMFGNK